MEKWACDFCGADMPARDLSVDIPGKHYEDELEDINEERKERGEESTTAEELGKEGGYIELAVCYSGGDDSLDCCPSCMAKLLAAAK